MNVRELVAQALLSWLEEHLADDADVARDSLPAFDVAYFMKGLAGREWFDERRYSLALTGLGLDEAELVRLSQECGLAGLRALSDDLHVAASWRNERARYGSIIALAHGRHPGVHTLKHFAKPSSPKLGQALLAWAQEDGVFAASAPQVQLLAELSANPTIKDLCSLEALTRFLEAWADAKGSDPLDAPRQALTALGLLYDPDLFAGNAIAARLEKNAELTRQLQEMAGSKLRERRRKVEQYKNQALKDELIAVLDKVEALRRGEPSSDAIGLSMEEALRVVSLPADFEADAGAPDDSTDEGDPESDRGPAKTPLDHSLEALLDGDDDGLQAISDALERAWAEYEPDSDDEVAGEYVVGDRANAFSLRGDGKFLQWLETFCSAEVWGGLLETDEPTLSIALEGFTEAQKEFIQPDAVLSRDGRTFSTRKICEDWDAGLAEEGYKDAQITAKWDRFRTARERLIPHLRPLVFSPLEWLAGRASVLIEIDEYLQASGSLYRAVQGHYRDMANVSEGWARALLEALLSFDVLQVHLTERDGKSAHKAVMLPTHPLHLWRYQRLASVLRGLGSSISALDREAIIRDVKRPEHFLSVICLGTIPSGRGANQILPVSNDLHGLATFENLVNAYTGVDGVNTLIYAVGRYVSLARHHARPLRVTVVNPPEPDKLMNAVVRFMNTPAVRQVSSLPRLRIELHATPQHIGRISAALRLGDEVRDLVQEKIGAGRLEFHVEERPRELSQIIETLKERPCHLIAIFDEASIRIRRRSAGRTLPMSPFCVRQQIRVERFEDLIRLEPLTDEPPFSEFMQLVNEADKSQRDSSPHAWADAESLRKVVDDLLIGEFPCAQWLMLADRALPTEGGMQAVRLLQRRDGQRQVLLATGDYRRISQLLRPAFDKSNLVLSSEEMEALLDEGVNLIGAGLLDLIQTRDGRADAKKVLGLTGTLLVARLYREQHPGALIVSVDQELARLWLRVGSATSLDRSDLIAVRLEKDGFVVEAIEVKTTTSEDVPTAVVTHATEQIAATLDALSQAIPGLSDGSVLSAPRNEMLKEVLVRGCQGRSVGSERRQEWGTWLKLLFRQTDVEPHRAVQLQGRVFQVLMSSNSTQPASVIKQGHYRIHQESIGEPVIQRLLQNLTGEIATELPPGDAAATSLMSGAGGDTPRPAQEPNSSGSGADANRQSARAKGIKEEPPRDLPPAEKDSKTKRATQTAAPEIQARDGKWPPEVNAFGMIGQVEAVRTLVNQANFAKAFGEKFTDKLLVGPAGVGKSSIARGIARVLVGEEELLFNGADLVSPSALVERLRSTGKFSKRDTQPVLIKKSLVFIDEVHAISGKVATVLLSAMDDARTTTIDGTVYDFSNVIFVLATTDPGKLSEAFNSRPDKTLLSPYSLEELAGIVWLHGRECLDGFEVSPEVCVEIAARMRCNPRRAVRALKEQLRPHFLQKLQDELGRTPSLKEIGGAMSLVAVSNYFDGQAIDMNGIDSTTLNFMKYLYQNGATSEQRLARALGVSNKGDFDEIDEYLVRLQLIEITSSGRALTKGGRRYASSGPVPLRGLISRQRVL